MKKEEIVKRLEIILENTRQNELYEYEIVANDWEGYGKNRTYFSIVEKSTNSKSSKHYVTRKYGYLDNINGEYVVEKGNADATENYNFKGAKFEIQEEKEETVTENTNTEINEEINEEISPVEKIKETVKDTFEMMKNGFEIIDADENRRKLANAKMNDMLQQELKQTNPKYWIELYTHYNDIWTLQSNLKNAINDNDTKLINTCMANIITAIRAYRKLNNI